MKKIVIACIAALALVGCVSDETYETGKKVYVAAKEIAPLIPKDQTTATALKIVDKVAVAYDGNRSKIKEFSFDSNESSIKTIEGGVDEYK